MGAYGHFTEARLPEGSRCGRGRPPEQETELMGGLAPSLNGWPGNQGTEMAPPKTGPAITEYRENSGRDDKPGKTGALQRAGAIFRAHCGNGRNDQDPGQVAPAHHQRSGGAESRRAASGMWQARTTACATEYRATVRFRVDLRRRLQAGVAPSPLHQAMHAPGRPINRQCGKFIPACGRAPIQRSEAQESRWMAQSRVHLQHPVQTAVQKRVLDGAQTPVQTRCGLVLAAGEMPAWITLHTRPLIRSSAASTSASSITRSWRLISSAFRHAHSSLSRAQLSPSALEPHGFSSLVVGAEFSPAGAVRPAGGFFFGSFMANGLSVVPASKAGAVGASSALCRGRRAHQKGFLIGGSHAFTLPSSRPVTQPVIPLFFFIEAPMQNDAQMGLPLMQRINGPSVVQAGLIKRIKSYREACRVAWQLRRIHYMTYRQLAAEAGLTYQHVGDYFNPDDKPSRRDLPGDAVSRVECVLGNTAISQWHAQNASLTVLEEMQATRGAA